MSCYESPSGTCPERLTGTGHKERKTTTLSAALHYKEVLLETLSALHGLDVLTFISVDLHQKHQLTELKLQATFFLLNKLVSQHVKFSALLLPGPLVGHVT